MALRPDSIIFVWDLDQTLAHKNNKNIINPYINDRALRCMHKLINSPRYGANLLLTNNSDIKYINYIQDKLTEKYNKMFPDEKEDSLFDNIYTAARERDNGRYLNPRVLDESVPEWIRTPNHLAKRLEDVEIMLREMIEKTYENYEKPPDYETMVEESLRSLRERVFFFDDLPNHNIYDQLPEGHYIQITPPFIGPGEDNTKYSTAENALLPIEIVVQGGGASKKYRKTKGKGKGKKRRGKKLTKRKSG